jgi:hypothetical protein
VVDSRPFPPEPATVKTFDDSTRAATPGRLPLSRRKYARYFGDSVWERMVRRLGCRLPWFMHGWPVVGPAVHHWTQIREVLEFGCLNPAAVLDAREGLVAVFTNLSNRERRPKPVVRIVVERLALAGPSPPGDGDRLAAACVYWRQPGKPAPADWDDFSAVVVDCLVDDPALCREARERINPAAWTALDLSVAGLSNREPGLHPTTVPLALIRDAY